MGHGKRVFDQSLDLSQTDSQRDRVGVVGDVIDESFGGSLENPTLQALQNMPMPQRRHAIILLLGGSVETLNAMQAFQHSVQVVERV